MKDMHDLTGIGFFEDHTELIMSLGVEEPLTIHDTPVF